jgi:hypothetical protein
VGIDPATSTKELGLELNNLWRQVIWFGRVEADDTGKCSIGFG